MGKNTEFFYFLHIILFANSEFIFAIRDPKLARTCLEYTLDTAQNRRQVLLLPLGKTQNARAGPTSFARFSVLPLFEVQGQSP